MAIVNGVVVGTVTAVNANGQVKVNMPWLDQAHETDWIRIATMMSGGNAGSFFMPNVQDEVLVAFDHGDTRYPYVVGFMWNGQDLPPGTDVRDRKLVSKNGHQIRFLDSTPSGGSLVALVIQDAHGNKVTMSNGKVHIESVAVLEIFAPTIILSGPGYSRVITPNSNPI